MYIGVIMSMNAADDPKQEFKYKSNTRMYVSLCVSIGLKKPRAVIITLTNQNKLKTETCRSAFQQTLI